MTEALTENKDVPVESIESIELKDCGQASEMTRGVAFMGLYELGTPPFNRRSF